MQVVGPQHNRGIFHYQKLEKKKKRGVLGENKALDCAGHQIKLLNLGEEEGEVRDRWVISEAQHRACARAVSSAI